MNKLWSGLRPQLQRDLWKEKLNPEVSRLKEVVATAEVLEIAQSVTGDYTPKPRRRRSKKRTTESAATNPDEPESSRRR